jgi:two-component sensor histidine kinase
MVAMRWVLKDGRSITLEWQESGGPEVSPPTHGGFGSRLIRLELTHELNGEVELIYDASGLKLMTSFPLSSHSVGLA